MKQLDGLSVAAKRKKSAQLGVADSSVSPKQREMQHEQNHRSLITTHKKILKVQAKLEEKMKACVPSKPAWEKRFQCFGCNKRFGTWTDLQSHRRSRDQLCLLLP